MIINRYLFKEIALSFAATLLVLTLIIVGNTFVRLLADASTGNLPADLVGNLLWFSSLKQLIRLIPVALLIGMMLAFSRLYRDSEMAALRAAGFAPRHFYRAIFSFVLPLTLLLAVLVIVVSPWLETNNAELRREINERPEAAGIPPGEFVSSGTAERNYTALAESIDPSRTVMERFFIRVKDGDNEVLIWAKAAVLFIDSGSGERVLQISEGYRYEADPAHGGMTVIRFGEHSIRIPLKDYTASHSLAAMSFLELWQKTDNAARAEMQWRIAVIVSAPLLAFLAFPLSYTAPRQGRYGKVGIAILIYAVYASILATVRGMIERGDFPALPGLWSVHLLILGLAFWLLRKYYGKPS
ncbi:LPS export ABC transporter permease LptF [Thiothrix fructosivorans]|uniref:Lipopolysaccharide export system permease protein LptF n=1 Tax=Thiothrix fructosivorans TaxID=111770 RepID=A0A8B0SH06_9GAMM|nr:LPS export ABC transporter permease LptF [Thiothrix fructosivorans]MBO0614235.1 LPS export ABC transporter permease LptF [Thiothrix fructosivorans]QTX09087.1 LPS export ABC transporter permease LptF [Thiothrix fructosivorans]